MSICIDCFLIHHTMTSIVIVFSVFLIHVKHKLTIHDSEPLVDVGYPGPVESLECFPRKNINDSVPFPTQFPTHKP
jgi:hypothetical protein